MNPIADLLGMKNIGFPKSKEFKTMITVGGMEDEIPMLIPTICSIKQIEAVQRGEIRYANSLAYFPPEHGWGMRSTIHLRSNQMKNTEIPCMFHDFTFFETDFIDLKNFDSLRKLTLERGSVFFKFKDAKKLPSMQFLATLKRKFKYNAIFHEYEDHLWFLKCNSENKSDLEIFVSLIDIKNAIPVFDPRKADGLAVVISVMKDAANLYDLAVVFSNNRKNLFVVDGQRINSDAQGLGLRRIASVNKTIRKIITSDPEKMAGELHKEEEKLITSYSLGIDTEGVELKVEPSEGEEDQAEEVGTGFVKYATTLSTKFNGDNTSTWKEWTWNPGASTTSSTDDNDTSN